MPISAIHQCQCEQCRSPEDHPDKELHEQINLVVSRLDEQQRRWFVALEAKRQGYGGVRLLSQITGMDEKTIERGQEELKQKLMERPTEQVRLAGGGRSPVEKKIQR